VGWRTKHFSDIATGTWCIPLPPYKRKTLQLMGPLPNHFAEHKGSVAAPTAACILPTVFETLLHVSPSYVTHVGAGTNP